MTPQTIGKNMTHGWAGCFARQPDMIVDTHKLGGSSDVPFGTPLILYSGAIIAADANATAANFLGVAGCEVKSSLSFTDQNTGKYAAGEPISVFKRGCINVKCNVGTPAFNGDVYLRITANAGIPAGKIGGFEASSDGAKTVLLPNCKWNGAADANGVAEMRITTMFKVPAASASVAGAVLQGVAVADAAGSAPTAAEFKALLDALRNAGIIAST